MKPRLKMLMAWFVYFFRGKTPPARLFRMTAWLSHVAMRNTPLPSSVNDSRYFNILILPMAQRGKAVLPEKLVALRDLKV